MLLDRTNSLAANDLQYIRKVAQTIINAKDLQKIYTKYQLNKPFEALDDTARYRHRCINWMFTMKCESGLNGGDFCTLILRELINTLKRNLNDLQIDYVKMMLDIFIYERSKFV